MQYFVCTPVDSEKVQYHFQCESFRRIRPKLTTGCVVVAVVDVVVGGGARARMDCVITENFLPLVKKKKHFRT